MADIFFPVQVRGKRLGTVIRYFHNRPSKQWVAFPLRNEDDIPLSEGFPTKKAAVEWLKARTEPTPA